MLIGAIKTARQLARRFCYHTHSRVFGGIYYVCVSPSVPPNAPVSAHDYMSRTQRNVLDKELNGLACEQGDSHRRAAMSSAAVLCLMKLLCLFIKFLLIYRDANAWAHRTEGTPSLAAQLSESRAFAMSGTRGRERRHKIQNLNHCSRSGTNLVPVHFSECSQRVSEARRLRQIRLEPGSMRLHATYLGYIIRARAQCYDVRRVTERGSRKCGAR